MFGPALRRSLLLALLPLLATGRASALPVPLETSIDGRWLSIVAHDADVLVRFDPAVRSVLQAFCQSETGAGGEITLERRLGGLAVTQPEAGEVSSCPRLRIEAALAPAQQLRIEGARLRVTVDDRGNPGVASPPPGQAVIGEAAGPARIELELEGSELTLLSTSGARAELRGSWLTGDALRGPTRLTFVGGGAELHDLSGGLNLDAENAEVLAEGIEGSLSFRLVGGALDVQNGSGEATGELHDAAGRFLGWRGPLVATAEGGQLDVRSSGADGAEIELIGRGTETFVDDVAGTLSVRLDGGSLAASAVTGEAKVDGLHEARVSVTGLSGALSLSLAIGSTAVVRDLAGNLKAVVEDGRLELDHVETVDFAAARSEVVGAGVKGLPRADATDGRVDLDLSEVVGSPRLALKRSAEGRVRLPSPCIVRASGSGTFDEARLAVTGCDYNAPNQGQRTAALRRTYGGKAIIFAVGLDEAARLEVSAEP